MTHMRAWLDGIALERSDAEDVVLATWEACVNAIEHAVDATDDVVTLSAELDAARIRVAVCDSGRWAPPTERRKPRTRVETHAIAHVVARHRGERDGHDDHDREDARRAHRLGCVRLEEPDQEQDHHDQRENSTAYVHRRLLPRST